jgi:hypothetical protein
MDSTCPSKDITWQTGLKRKLQQSVVYKRPISLTETNNGLAWKARRRFTKSMPPLKQAGVTILISDKVDFKLTLLKWDKEGYFTLIKGKITPKANDNYQNICTRCQCTQFHQTYFKGLKSTHRLQHSGSGRL